LPDRGWTAPNRLAHHQGVTDVPGSTDLPESTQPPSSSGQKSLDSGQASGEVIRVPPPQLHPASGHRASSGLRQELAVLRDRVAVLSRNPAAVATATVVTGLAVRAVREAVKDGALRRNPAATPVAVTGYVISHVHVVHHVVHHVAHRGGAARALPPAFE
jgi:hypothetical protein